MVLLDSRYVCDSISNYFDIGENVKVFVIISSVDYESSDELLKVFKNRIKADSYLWEKQKEEMKDHDEKRDGEFQILPHGFKIGDKSWTYQEIELE